MEYRTFSPTCFWRNTWRHEWIRSIQLASHLMFWIGTSLMRRSTDLALNGQLIWNSTLATSKLDFQQIKPCAGYSLDNNYPTWNVEEPKKIQIPKNHQIVTSGIRKQIWCSLDVIGFYSYCWIRHRINHLISFYWGAGGRDIILRFSRLRVLIGLKAALSALVSDPSFILQ